MRRAFNFRANLTDEDISEIWKNIYDENPQIKQALLNARSQHEEGQQLVTNLFKSFFHSELAQDIAETEGARDRLYKYWKEAGLEGSPEQIFNEYLVKHSDKYMKLDTFDFNKPAWDKSQSRVARDNMLITLMQKRLEDPQTIEARTTPGGFTHASAAAKYIRRLMGIDNINYDYSDPWTMIVYNQQNQVAGKLIGIFANQNTNNAIASLMKEFSLVKPVAFGDHLLGLSNLLNPNALTKELLAASVDAVKDPVLNFLNLNTITADSAGMLCRLGYSFEEIGLLMNQPIIRYLCDYCMDNNMNDIDTAINNVLQDWKAKGDYETRPSNELTTKVLESNIEAYRDNPGAMMNNEDFLFRQAQVLSLFKTIYASAKDIGNFITNTKFTASNAVKSTFGGMYAQQDRVIKYVNNLSTSENPRITIKVSDTLNSPLAIGLDVSNVDEYMSQILNNPFGYEQVMYDANVVAIKEFGKYFPYDNPTYRSVRETINDLTKSGLNEDTINQIHEYMLRYMIEIPEHSKFNPEYPKDLDNGETVRAEDYYSNYVPYEVADLLNRHKELRELPVFDYLVFEDNNDGNLQMRVADSGALAPVQKEEMRDSWEILFRNPKYRNIAEKLYMYSFYKSGFGFGVIGFNHLAPLELKLNLMINEELSYVDFLNKVLDDSIPVNPTNFAKEFIKTHRKNRQLIYEPKSKQLTYIKGKIYQNGLPADDIYLDYSKDSKEVEPFILRTTNRDIHFKPAIIVDGLLYIADGENFNRTKSGQMKYSLVPDSESKKISMADVITPESSTSIEGEEIVELDKLSVDELIDRVFEVGKKLGYFVEEERNKRINELKYSSQNDLIDTLLAEYKDQGVKCKLNGEEIC